MKLYGKVLVNNLPEATTNLLINLCTGYTKRGGAASLEPSETVIETSNPVQEQTAVRAALKSAPEEFIHIYVNQAKWLTKFLEIMIKEQPNSSTIVYNTLLELYLKGTVNTKSFYFDQT